MKTVLTAMLLAALSLTASGQDKKPAPKLPEGAKFEADLAYVEKGHERNRLDLYLPKSTGKPTPLIIWIHGGAWLAGDKRGTPALLFLEKGYAVASINYRYSTQAVFPAQIEDCKAAVRWLRASAKTYNLDADHFGVWGASAGGHLVALLGTSGDVKDLEGTGGNAGISSRVQCVIDWFGPTDFTAMPAVHDKPDGPIYKLLGGPLSQNKDKAAKANPIAYITTDDPPFLIMHGDKDTVVPLGQSELLLEALKKAGVEVKLVTLAGAGHGGPDFSKPEQKTLIEEFFAKHLKP